MKKCKKKSGISLGYLKKRCFGSIKNNRDKRRA